MSYYYSGWIFIIPALLITVFAQIKVKLAFSRAEKIKNSKGLSGAEVAEIILKHSGLSDIPISEHSGRLSDHYDPINKSLHLSPEVFSGTSVGSIGVAAHEVGHALQHKAGNKFLKIRTAIFPVVNFGSSLAPIFIIMGFIFSVTNLIMIGIIFFSASVVFTLVTLPVEFDASRRAMRIINSLGLVTASESREVKKVLSAAALTYVAAALAAILELLRLIMIARSRD